MGRDNLRTSSFRMAGTCGAAPALWLPPATGRKAGGGEGRKGGKWNSPPLHIPRTHSPLAGRRGGSHKEPHTVHGAGSCPSDPPRSAVWRAPRANAPSPGGGGGKPRRAPRGARPPPQNQRVPILARREPASAPRPALHPNIHFISPLTGARERRALAAAWEWGWRRQTGCKRLLSPQAGTGHRPPNQSRALRSRTADLSCSRHSCSHT